MSAITFTLDQVIALLQSAHATHPTSGHLRQTAPRLAAEFAKLIDADHTSIHLLHDWIPEPNLTCQDVSAIVALSADPTARHLPECLTGEGIVTMFADASYVAGRRDVFRGQIEFHSSTIVSIARGRGDEAPTVIALGRDTGRPGFTHCHLKLIHVMHRALPIADGPRDMQDQKSHLPPREASVLEQLKEGLSEKQIAAELKLSQHTIHTYVKNIYRRFGVTSRSQLLSLWLQRGGDHSGIGRCGVVTRLM
jgi:DNA-binding CsgD family transcriptional regulator